MIDVLQEIEAAETDLIDFVPDPSQLGRVPRERGGLPHWLIAALATAAVLIAILVLHPGPAVAHAESALPDAPPAAHQDLFQLPEWHEEPAGQTGK